MFVTFPQASVTLQEVSEKCIVVIVIIVAIVVILVKNAFFRNISYGGVWYS